MGDFIRIGLLISRSRDHDDILKGAGHDRILKSLTVSTAAPAGIDNIRSVFTRVVDDPDRVRSRPTVLADKSQGHQVHLPCHSGDSKTIVTPRPDCARNMSPVPLLIHRVVVIVIGIPAKSARFRMLPHIWSKIFMGVSHSGISDGHRHPGGILQDVPALQGIDVGSNERSRCHAGVVQ